MHHKTSFTIPLDKVRRRADFFIGEAERQCATPRFASLGLSVTRANAEMAAEAYFLLTEAYRARRLDPGRLTQPSKIAALTCLTIASLDPLRPASVPEAITPEFTFANALLALRLACNIVDHPFHQRPWFQMLWFANGLKQDVPLPSLTKYIEQTASGARQIGDEFELDLSSQELRRIETRVGFFCVLGDMRGFEDAGAKK